MDLYLGFPFILLPKGLQTPHRTQAQFTLSMGGFGAELAKTNGNSSFVYCLKTEGNF
jgi:hypothetical protein